jgi:hypothetical protein
MLSYLSPVAPHITKNGDTNGTSTHRVIDRHDMQELLQLALPLEAEE